MDQKRKRDEELKKLEDVVDIRKTGEVINKQVSEKAFLIDQKKRQEEKLKGIGTQVDITKTAGDISKSIEEKGAS